MTRILQHKRSFLHWILFFVLISIALAAIAVAQPSGAKRAMTFMDVLLMRSTREADVSPDKRWVLYTLTVPDWKAGRRFSDIYLVSLQNGFVQTRQMTFTAEKDESSARWSRDGRFFVFLSNRDAPSSAARQNQLYLMRPDDGG